MAVVNDLFRSIPSSRAHPPSDVPGSTKIMVAGALKVGGAAEQQKIALVDGKVSICAHRRLNFGRVVFIDRIALRVRR